MIDTLEFAEAFEAAGFEPNKAKAHDAGREDLTTKGDLAVLKAELLQAIAESAEKVGSRLWSTVAIIAGVSTAISATIGAGVATLLRSGGL